MKTIDELQAELRLICSELEKLKESQKAETREVNFREIAARAERYPILGHPMVNEDEHTKDMYILMLLSVAALDDEKYEESFMTIYRIAFGMWFSGNIESLFLSAKSMKFETLDECTRLFLNSKLRLVLLLECMMIAAGFENGKRKAMEYISQLAVMLNVGKDEIEFLANLARVVLTQDLNEYKLDVQTDTSLYDCYLVNFLSEFDIQFIEVPYSIIRKGRQRILLHVIDNADINFFIDNYKIIDEKLNIVYKFKDSYNDDSRTEVIDLNGKIIDYYLKKYNKSNHRNDKVLVGVTSKHPLAHSMAMKKYKDAGGIIE